MQAAVVDLLMGRYPWNRNSPSIRIVVWRTQST